MAEATAAQGSFLFPPTQYGESNSLEDYAQFWQNVPVGDRVLSNLVYAYAVRREQWVGEQVEKALDARAADPEHQAWYRDKKNIALDIENAHWDFVNAKFKEIRASDERPYELSPLVARQTAIAARMVHCRSVLAPAIENRVWDYNLYTSSSGEPRTVRYLWDTYHLGEIADRAFTDQDIAVAGAIAKLQSKLVEKLDALG